MTGKSLRLTVDDLNLCRPARPRLPQTFAGLGCDETGARCEREPLLVRAREREPEPGPTEESK